MAETGDASVSSGKPWSGGGREELASAVRRLTTAVVTSAASPEMLEHAAERGQCAGRGPGAPRTVARCYSQCPLCQR